MSLNEDNRKDYSIKALGAFAAHTRSVHFALVTASFALLAAHFISQEPKFERATTDLRRIMDTRQLWQSDKDWLDRYAQAWLQERGLTIPPHLTKALDELAVEEIWASSSGGGRILHGISSRRWTLRDQRTAPFEISNSKETTAVLYLAAPQSLSEFRDLWSELEEPLTVYVPDKVPTHRFDQIDNTQVKELSYSYGGGKDWPNRDSPRDLVLAPYQDQKRVSEILEKLAFGASWRTHAFFFARKTVLTSVGVFTEIPAHYAFNEHFGTDFPAGPFERSFAALNELTATYQDLDFDKVSRILVDARRTAGPRFEAFGASVPSAVLARWGIPIVLTIQLYLWVHLREYRKKLGVMGVRPETPWIPMYSGLVARTVSCLSVAALPLVAVGVPAFREYLRMNSMSTLMWWLLVCGGLAAVLAVCSLRELAGVRTAAPATP